MSDRIARFSTFVTLGVLATTQDLVGLCFEGIEGVNPDLVAEETLALVAVTTARAAEVGLRAEPDVSAAVVPTLLRLPFLYRDYLVGSAMIASGDPALLDADDAAYGRLEHKLGFYTAQFPVDQFPGERLLLDKMTLWMGRISPPRLPDMPAERLEKAAYLSSLLTHLKLVLAYGRKGGDPS